MRAAITEALMAKTQALVGGYPVAWENTRFEEPAELFLRASLLPVDEAPETIFPTQLFSVAIGIWQVAVNGPAAGASPMGPGEVNAVVDAIKDLFRPGTVLTATSDPAVTVRLVAVADAPALPGVDRYTVPVSVRYRAARVH